MGCEELDRLHSKAGSRGCSWPGVAAKWTRLDGAPVSERAPAGAECEPRERRRLNREEDAGGAHSPRACSEPLHTGACRPGRAGELEECSAEAALLKVNHRVQLPFPREPGGGPEKGERVSARLCARERRFRERRKVPARRSKQTNRRWNKSGGRGWSPPGSSQSREPSAPRATHRRGQRGDRGRRRGLRRLWLSPSRRTF